MSEEKYEVWIDPNPELWDLGYEVEGIKVKIDYAKENYIRKGSCKKCGKCCYWRDKDGSLKPCKYLVNGNECSVYDKPERPRICKEFPPKPTLNQEYYEGNMLLQEGEITANPIGCGFYWIRKSDLE